MNYGGGIVLHFFQSVFDCGNFGVSHSTSIILAWYRLLCNLTPLWLMEGDHITFYSIRVRLQPFLCVLHRSSITLAWDTGLCNFNPLWLMEGDHITFMLNGVRFRSFWCVSHRSCITLAWDTILCNLTPMTQRGESNYIFSFSVRLRSFWCVKHPSSISLAWDTHLCNMIPLWVILGNHVSLSNKGMFCGCCCQVSSRSVY